VQPVRKKRVELLKLQKTIDHGRGRIHGKAKKKLKRKRQKTQNDQCFT
jgi:hypothetical protein